MADMLQPLRIRSMILHNRLVMPPMATSKADPDGSINQALLDYYDEKSKGGHIGLIITEHSYVSAEGKAGMSQIGVADDSVPGKLKELCDVIHKNGSKAVVQINHAGSIAKRAVIGTTPVGPSAVMNPRPGGEMPQALSEQEIEKIISMFTSAALRVKQAGFDGVEIHSAHGYLLNQFFSPLTNKREDDYGGSVMNRIRIHVEIVKAIRSAVGQEYPILLRLGASDYMEGGITLEDSLIAARELERAGVDVLDISGGFCMFSIPNLADPPQGYFSPLTEAIKKEVDIPVLLTGGIVGIAAAQRLVTKKKADLIGVGRAILNDSLWAKRAMEQLH